MHSENAGASAGADLTAQLCAAVRNAAAGSTPLLLRGGGSKMRLLGRRCEAPILEVREHSGVVSYRPDEMVLTARAGTSIRELNALTAAQGQCLPFEAGEFDGHATLGGTLAGGLSGPARPWRGSMRDAVLGLRLINGQGECLRFGGEVMKNVAGYDVSRLQAGALGTLGLITEVSLRLLPLPAQSLQLACSRSAAVALDTMRALARRPLPLTGACWRNGTLHLRFAGSEAALRAIAAELPEFSDSADAPWEALREWSLPEFRGDDGFWCFDFAPAAPLTPAVAPDIIDWAGARRFSRAALTLQAAQDIAGAADGHATRMGRGHSEGDVTADPAPALRALQRRIKQAVDPGGVFNPGRLHRWL